MNLHEYLTQKNPVKLAPYSVQVEKKDLKFHGFILNNKGLKMELVTVKKLGFTYIVLNDRGSLWTTNENGTPARQSVFTLI